MLNSKIESKYFYKILISFFLVIAFTIAVVSSILYINFERISKELIFKTTKSKLFQSSYSIKFQSEYVEGLALRMNEDDSITRLFNASKLSFSDLNKSTNVLDSYRFSSQMIHSIYLIDKNDSKVFITADQTNQIAPIESFYDQNILQYVNNHIKFNKLTPIPRTVSILAGNGTLQTSNVYSYIYYNSFDYSDDISNFVVINVSSSWMFNTLKLMDDEMVEKNTFIVDNSGNIVFSSDTSNTLKGNYINRTIKCNAYRLV